MKENTKIIEDHFNEITENFKNLVLQSCDNILNNDFNEIDLMIYSLAKRLIERDKKNDNE